MAVHWLPTEQGQSWVQPLLVVQAGQAWAAEAAQGATRAWVPVAGWWQTPRAAD